MRHQYQIWKSFTTQNIGNKNTRNYEHPFRPIGKPKAWMDEEWVMSIIVDCQGIMFAWYQLHTLEHSTNIHNTTIVWANDVLTHCTCAIWMKNPCHSQITCTTPQSTTNQFWMTNYINNTHEPSLFPSFECIGGYRNLSFSLNALTHYTKYDISVR